MIHEMVPSGVHAWTDFKMRNVHSITDGLNMDAIKIEKKIYISGPETNIFIFLSFFFCDYLSGLQAAKLIKWARAEPHGSITAACPRP